MGLYNSAVDEAVNPNVGQKICSVETSLTFPKDLIEVSSVSFVQNDSNNYSNTNGVVNFKAELSPCTTIVGVDLFTVNFNTKKIGEGAIHFTSSVVVGGEDSITTLQSGVYDDVRVTVVPIEQYQEPVEPKDPLPSVPANVPKPKVQSVSNGATKATAQTPDTTKKEDPAYKVPTLSKLEFGASAVLNKALGQSKGAVFSGMADPNIKVNLLINSETILDSVTSGADGAWTYTLKQPLEDGTHQITAWSEKDNKISKKLVSKFVISSYAKNQIAIGDTYPEMAPDQASNNQLGAQSTASGKIDKVLKNKYFLVYAGIGLVVAVVLVIIIFSKRRHKAGAQTGYDPSSGIEVNSVTGTGIKQLQDEINQPAAVEPQANIGQDTNDREVF